MVAHTHRRLHRSQRNRVLLGVAGGLGEYFGIDPVLFRIAFVAGSLIGGAGVVAYLVLAAVLPVAGEEEGVEAYDGLTETTGVLWAGILAGLTLVGLGLLFMVGDLTWLARINWGVILSILLVALGAVLVLRRAR
jgi:phage shock protein C